MTCKLDYSTKVRKSGEDIFEEIFELLAFLEILPSQGSR